jgi:hypothetical protein
VFHITHSLKHHLLSHTNYELNNCNTINTANMRVTSIVLAAGLALFANAQTTTGNTTPSQTQDAASAAASSAQAEVLRCLNTCKPEDVNCRAACIAVPSPSDQQANATVNCVAACPIGKGTEADNNAFTKCTTDCVTNNYYDPNAGTPQPTGGSSSGGNGNSDSGDDSNDSNGDSTDGNDDATGTDDSEGTQTSDGPSPSQSTGAASLVGASSGVVGILGFVAAIMAL